MKWYWHVLRYEYANFKGRARRAEFWSFQIINHIIIYVLLIVGYAAILQLFGSIFPDFTGMTTAHTMSDGEFERNISSSVFSVSTKLIILAAYLLLTAIPSIAVTVRRLHDAGFSGWLVLLHIIPNGMGTVALIILCSLESKPGTNEYGPNPKDNQEFQLSV